MKRYGPCPALYNMANSWFGQACAAWKQAARGHIVGCKGLCCAPCKAWWMVPGGHILALQALSQARSCDSIPSARCSR